MNDLRHASAGEVWTLCYRENDHDPWIYLILSLDHNGVNMFIYIYHDGLAHVVLNLQTGELNFFHLLREMRWKKIG